MATIEELYRTKTPRRIYRDVRIAGALLDHVISVDYGFSMQSVPTATIKYRGEPPAAVRFFAPVQIETGFNGTVQRRFTGKVQHVNRDGPDVIIECSGTSAALDVPYHAVVKTFTNILQNDALEDLLDDAGVLAYQVDVDDALGVGAPWTIGTVLQPTLSFQTYGEAVSKVAEVGGHGWYEFPSGTVRVARIDPIPSLTAAREFFSMRLTGPIAAHPTGITATYLGADTLPHMRSTRAEQQVREIKNQVFVRGGVINVTQGDGSVTPLDITGSTSAPSPWVLNPDGSQAYNDFIYNHELIDTVLVANIEANRLCTVLNRLTYRTTIEVDYDPTIVLGETIRIEDPDYTRLAGNWIVVSYQGHIDETDASTTITCIGGIEAGGTPNNDPFPFFVYTIEREVIGTKEYALVTFNALLSVDFDGSIVSYQWSDNQAPNIASGTTAVYTVRVDPTTLVDPWIVTLTVTDDQGATGTLALTVNIALGAQDVYVPAIFLAFDNRFSATPDGGQTWNDQTAPGGDSVISVGALAKGNTPPGGAVYGTLLGALYLTTDFCATAPTLVLAAVGSPFVHELADPNNMTHIYALTRDGRVYRSLDKGAAGTWALFDNLRTIFALPAIRANRIALPPAGGIWVYGGEGNGLPLIAIAPDGRQGEWFKAPLGGELGIDLGLGGASTPYLAAVLADAPTVYYRMDEGLGQPQDSSGNGLHTTATIGTPDYAQTGALADANTAIRLVSASTEAFTTPDNALLDPGDTFTLELWAKRTADGVEQIMLDKGANGYMIEISAGNVVRIAKQNVGFLASSTASVLAANGFHHIVWTKAGATNHIYVNGVDVTGTVTNQTIAATATDLQIGRGFAPDRYFNGTLDEIAIYPTALSAARVLAHYQAAFVPPSAVAADPTLYIYEAASHDIGDLAIILDSVAHVPAVYRLTGDIRDPSGWRRATGAPAKSHGRYIGPDLETSKYIIAYNDTLLYRGDLTDDVLNVTLATGTLQAGDAPNHGIFIGYYIGGMAGAYLFAAEGSADGTVWKTWDRGETTAKFRPATGFPGVVAGNNAKQLSIGDPANVTLDLLYAGQSPIAAGSTTYSRTVARLDALWTGVTQPAQVSQVTIGWYRHHGVAFYRLVNAQLGTDSHMRPPGFGQLQRSTDLITWTDVGPTPQNGSSNWGIVNMDRAANGWLWAVAGDQANGTIAPILYKSVDEGLTWTPVLTGFTGQCYIDVACHPSNADIVTVIADDFPGIMHLQRTTNATGAASFTGYIPAGDTTQSTTHVRNGVMLASGEMVITTAASVKWITADYATATNGTGLVASSFGGYVIRNSNGSILFKLHNLTDVYRSRDGGRSWTKVNTSALPTSKALVYDELKDKLYVGGQGASDSRYVLLFPNAGTAALPIPDADVFDITLNLDAIFSANGDEVGVQGLFR